jgi:hypothetical protein
VTSQEQKAAQSVDHDIPDTEVIVVSAPSPVFVDSTGRRRRLLRRLSYAFGGLCLLYGGLVSVSLAGGPVSSSAILPLPDLGTDATAEARPSPIPLPTIAAPKARAIIEALPRHDLPAAGNNRFGATRPVATPTAPRATGKPATPKPTATSSRPVESTATPTPSASPSTSGSPTPSTSPTSGPTRQPPPVPPETGTGSGSGGSTPGGSGGASAMPAPPAGAPTTEVADATPAPSPQTPVPGRSDFSAPTGGPGGGSTRVPA